MGKALKLIERFAKPKKTWVKFINYAATNLCNSRCTTCNIWQLYKPGAYNLGKNAFLSELKPFEIRKSFQDSKCLNKLKNINLTGGEPFLKKDFVEITSVFRELFPKAGFNITSNGLESELILKKLNEITGLGIVPNLTFSIDGTEKIHDRVRGINGGFKKTMNTISMVKKEFPELKLALSFTINPTNYHELSKVFRLSKELEIAFITRFALVNKGFYKNNEMILDWNPKSLEETRQALMQIKKEKHKNTNSLVALFSAERFFFNNMLKQSSISRRNYNCFSGTHGFFLDPYGNAKACFVLEQVFGNIKKQKFDELWFSENAKKIRAFIEAKKCNCWTECDTIPSLEKNNAMVLADNLIDSLRLK